MMRALLIPSLVGVAIAGFSSCSEDSSLQASFEARPGEVPHKRLVLITLDTLRHDSFFGAEGTPGDMPLTRQWAADALAFDRYYSVTSSTQPSHATLFTGLQPWQHGVTYNGVTLDEELETLAEKLQGAGYRTGAAVASYPVHSAFGYDQGFDVFLDSFNSGQAWNKWVGQPVEAQGGFFASGDYILEEAMALIDGLGGEKQFLWFHFFDPHWPYGDREGGFQGRPTAELINRLIDEPEMQGELLAEIRAGYQLDVAAMDRDLDTLFKRLDADGIETHVVIVSDHGESLGESSSLGHGMRLTPEQILCPLIVRSPRVQAGTSSLPVGSCDVAATLLSLAGIEESFDGGRDLTSPTSTRSEPVFGMRSTFKSGRDRRLDGRVLELNEGESRFFVVEGEAMYTGDSELVTRGDDGVSIGESETSTRLKSIFSLLDAELQATRSGQTVDEATLRALEALGYTGNE